MTTIYGLPQIEIRALGTVQEARPVALLTGRESWSVVSTAFNELPLVVQAEPLNADRTYLDSLADSLPPQVEVIYGVGGGLVCDVAKYIGARRKLPVTLIPTALSVDGFFTPIVAVREGGSVGYADTGPAARVFIDWEIIRNAPPDIRGTGIVEILSIVTGLLDWRLAAERGRNLPAHRFQPWAAAIAATIAQQAFKIAKGVGAGRVESLQELLDLICMEVQLTNQLGHTRPQEGSEQYFAYAIEPKVTRGGRGIPYSDLVGPGILIAAALHGQDVAPIRDTISNAGARLGQLRPDDIISTLRTLPQFVKDHNLPYSILNEIDPYSDKVTNILSLTGLDMMR
jgi:glycerol-1-phosphate dehydrogenase [NAD(P)+]